MEDGLRIELTGDELILAVLSLVRAIDPRMLRPDHEGFEVDFRELEEKKKLSADELLLLKLRAALEGSPIPAAQTPEPPSEPRAVQSPGAYALELAVAQARRLSETLERLESLQPWPPDALALSRNLRARLAALAQ